MDQVKINKIYTAFKAKLADILKRRNLLFKTYRTRLEEAKMNEIKDSINNQK